MIMRDNKALYQLDGKINLSVAIPLGLQHVLAMFVGNVTPLIIIASSLGLSLTEKTMLVQCAMFVSGITTLIQCYKFGPFGSGLPIVMGTSFAFVPIGISVGAKYGYEAVLGSCLVAALFEVFLGYYIKKLRRFFPPVVTGTLVLAIGITLLPVGVNYLAGGVGAEDYGSYSNLLLGFIVLATILFCNQYTKGITKMASILVGLIVGYIVAIPMGKIDFSQLSQVGMLAAPMPFKYGFEFRLDAILGFMSVFLVSGVETVGDISAIAHSGLGREATDKEISGGVMSDGFGSMIATLFNSLPTTSFGQNVGMIAMTKIVNRNVVGTGAVFLILAAIFPKLGALISLMPSSVLGGATIMMFAMIAISGIKLMISQPLNSRNTTISSVALGLGVGFAMVPQALAQLPEPVKLILGDSYLIVVVAVAVLLNIILPKENEEIQEVIVEKEECTLQDVKEIII